MQAITLAVPPQSRQVSTSMLNTRLSRCAQIIDMLRCAGVFSSCSSATFCRPLPRLAGVTQARCLLFGANTPWKRVRFTLGLGTRAVSLAMKSTGSKMTWVVPSRYGVFMIINVADLHRETDNLFRLIGISDYESPKIPTALNQSNSSTYEFSEKEVANLERWYEKDIKIYHFLTRLQKKRQRRKA